VTDENMVRAGRIADAARELPAELIYRLSPALAWQISAEPRHPAPASGTGDAR
jgi:hypothetical protein